MKNAFQTPIKPSKDDPAHTVTQQLMMLQKSNSNVQNQNSPFIQNNKSMEKNFFGQETLKKEEEP
jgi:hypothetical protein